MSREEEYLRRMKALGYEPGLAGMDDEDIEWELAKMDEAERRQTAPPQPARTVYRPVDPGLVARIFRWFGQPYDESAIPKGQEFYLNGWDGGEDDSAAGNTLRTMEDRPRDGTMLPSRGDAIRPLSYTAGGNDVNTGRQETNMAGDNRPASWYAEGGAYGNMTLPEGTQQSANNRNGNMAYPDLNDEQKLYIATVAGEAGGSSEKAQRSVAHVIMNRVGYKDWAKHDTVAKLLTPDQFSSINDTNNQPFQEMAKYLQNRDGSNPRLERLINTAMNVYHGKVPDFTGGAVMFYSPKAQAQLHRERPDLYLKEVPADWDFEQLQKLPVPIEEDDDFLFFKYK